MATVLIVDDEESIRFSYGLTLKDAGHRVVTTEYLDEAKEILETVQFDVVITDRLIRSHDGMELIEYINKNHPYCATILNSAYPGSLTVQEGSRHRVFAYLQKPLNVMKLCETVQFAARRSMEKQIIPRNLQQIRRQP